MDCVPHCVSFGIGDRNCVALSDTAEGRCVMNIKEKIAKLKGENEVWQHIKNYREFDDPTAYEIFDNADFQYEKNYKKISALWKKLNNKGGA